MLSSHLENAVTRCLGVHTAPIGDDRDTMLHDVREDLITHVDQILGITKIGVPHLLLLQNGHGDLGKVVEHQVVDGTTRYLAERCAGQIAPKTLSGCDANA